MLYIICFIADKGFPLHNLSLRGEQNNSSQLIRAKTPMWPTIQSHFQERLQCARTQPHSAITKIAEHNFATVVFPQTIQMHRRAFRFDGKCVARLVVMVQLLRCNNNNAGRMREMREIRNSPNRGRATPSRTMIPGGAALVAVFVWPRLGV